MQAFQSACSIYQVDGNRGVFNAARLNSM